MTRRYKEQAMSRDASERGDVLTHSRRACSAKRDIATRVSLLKFVSGRTTLLLAAENQKFPCKEQAVEADL